MFVGLVNLVRGWVEIEVHGLFLERFLNLCIKQNIYLWHVRRNGKVLTLRLSLQGFRLLRPIAKKTGTRVKIIKKRGLPFTLHRHRRRKLFVAGAAVALLLLVYLGSFIWVIEVEGNETIPESDIRILLKTCGLDAGVLKYTIDPDALQQAAVLEDDRISWLWVDVRGTKAYVSVKERTLPIEAENTQVRDLFAAEAGVVTKTTVKRGTPAVAVGDTVFAGQLVISGTNAAGTPVAAEGEIWARVWYEKTALVGYIKEERHDTGRTSARYTLRIGSLPLSVGSKAPYAACRQEEVETHLRLFGDFYLPVTLTKTVYWEEEVEKITVSREEAVADAKAYLADEAAKAAGEAALVTQFVGVTEVSEDRLQVTYTGEFLKNIARAADE